jgi:ubiquinone/menaquinone biosynthesis C-methylase UbiE
MPTHQQIANVSDAELVERMVTSHPDRFDPAFWDDFSRHFQPALSSSATLIDIGCGPGLFLRDLRQRFPSARLLGTDVTPAMIEYAKQQDYSGTNPEYHLHDIVTQPLPLADHSADFVSMVAVLHVLDNPFPVLTEIRRVMAPTARFMLQDWVRTPLPVYLDRMLPASMEPGQRLAVQGRLLPLFTVHNKYTLDDWIWVLQQAGFSIEDQQQLGSPHFRTFVCRAR